MSAVREREGLQWPQKHWHKLFHEEVGAPFGGLKIKPNTHRDIQRCAEIFVGIADWADARVSPGMAEFIDRAKRGVRACLLHTGKKGLSVEDALWVFRDHLGLVYESTSPGDGGDRSSQELRRIAKRDVDPFSRIDTNWEGMLAPEHSATDSQQNGKQGRIGEGKGKGVHGKAPTAVYGSWRGTGAQAAAGLGAEALPRYACVVCGERFLQWKLCLEHMRQSGHKGSQDACHYAAMGWNQ